MQRAISERSFGKLLRAYRAAFVPALTQADLANWLDLSQAQVSRIESGRTPVNDLAKLTLWSERLNIPTDTLWFSNSNNSHDVLSHPTRLANVDGTNHEDESVRRRDFLKTASLGAVASVADTTLPTMYLPRQRISHDDVSVVREATTAFRNLDNRFGGGAASAVVASYISSEVSPTLNNDSFARGVRKEYQRAAVELYQLAGWMAYDVGDVAAGRVHLRHALELATDANDDALVAEMLAAMSHQAAFHKGADEAIDMALAARRAAIRSGAPALRVIHAA